jgi:glycerol kinase
MLASERKRHSMKTPLLLALDQGTTSTRSIAFGADLAPRATMQMELPQHFPSPGWVEHEPEDIWQAYRYYIRIRHAYSSAADTIKVIMVSNKSKDTSALVRDEVRLIQKQCPEFDPQFKLYSDYM